MFSLAPIRVIRGQKIFGEKTEKVYRDVASQLLYPSPHSGLLKIEPAVAP